MNGSAGPRQVAVGSGRSARYESLHPTGSWHRLDRRRREASQLTSVANDHARSAVKGDLQRACRYRHRMTAGTVIAAVIAIKPMEHAKSRLAVPDALRRRLAWTMALDTLSALCGALAHVLVVSDQPALEERLRRAGLAAEVISESGHVGINSALTRGGACLRAQGFTSIMACVGDLPALRPESVARVLEASRSHPRSFVADASGVGTTMLVAHDVDLAPQFQGRSAAAHHTSGAVSLSAEAIGSPVADARCDVDTEADLTAAIELGVGPATSALIDHEKRRLGRYVLITATQWSNADGDQMAVTASGTRIALPADALRGELRHAQLGQRLHAVEADGRVLSVWI
jgi:2-phospho-L-lactate guanylyltransferase